MKIYLILSVLTIFVCRSSQKCEYIEAKSKNFEIKREYRHYNERGYWEPRWYEQKIYPTLYFTIYCNNVTFRIGEELQANYKENSSYPLHLEIDRSSIPEIPVGVLIKFSSVTTILLNGNQVQSIQPGAFSGLGKLEELYLQDNNITEITNGVLNSITNLKILDLSNNRLQQIEHHSFLGLMKLETLRLRSNRLTQIHPQLFITQKLLKFIDLSGNNIRKLQGNAFSNLSRLQTVLLNATGIRSLEYNVFQNTSISELDMSSNNITLFNVSYIPNSVRKLLLDRNNISNVSWDKIQNLLFLDLSSNNIGSILNFTGTVQFFNISRNKIKTLNFTMPSSAEKIDLSFNLINLVNHIVFLGLRKLIFLTLKHNNILFIPPGTFKDLESLTYLDISDNKIKELEFGLFSGLINVRTLKLENNALKDLPELTFHELANLEKINLSNNLLSNFVVDDFVQHLKKLKEIDLSNNTFKCSDLFKAIKKFEHNKIIVLKGNVTNSSNVYGMSCISNGVMQIQTENKSTAIDKFVVPNLYQLQKYILLMKNIFNGTVFKNSSLNFLDLLNSFGKHSISNSSIVNFIVRRNYDTETEINAQKLHAKVDEYNYGVFCVLMIIISLILFVIMCVLLYVFYIMFYKSEKGVYHVQYKRNINNSITNEIIVL